MSALDKCVYYQIKRPREILSPERLPMGMADVNTSDRRCYSPRFSALGFLAFPGCAIAGGDASQDITVVTDPPGASCVLERVDQTFGLSDEQIGAITSTPGTANVSKSGDDITTKCDKPVLLRDCPHCPATHSTFRIQWAGRLGNEWRVTATCGACGDILGARVLGPGNPTPLQVDGNIERPGFFMVAECWPKREDLSSPPFTPGPTAKRFIDAEFNFQNGRWNAAVGMYRAALDLATKELHAQGGTFFARLQWLNAQGRVTADIKDWADHVRVEGNGALHDPEEFEEADATALRHFTTMFLRYVFEMPGLVAEFRNPAAP